MCLTWHKHTFLYMSTKNKTFTADKCVTFTQKGHIAGHKTSVATLLTRPRTCQHDALKEASDPSNKIPREERKCPARWLNDLISSPLQGPESSFGDSQRFMEPDDSLPGSQELLDPIMIDVNPVHTLTSSLRSIIMLSYYLCLGF